MKSLFGWGLCALAAVAARGGELAVTLPEASPAAAVRQVVGITEIAVSYHRPSVNHRKVWGGLVPYGFTDQGFGTSKSAPWRAGANENTVVSFQHPMTIAGQPLPAGAYGLAMAVAADGHVTVIFSRDNALWGSFFYDPANDALRVTVTWEDAPYHEQLTYEFDAVTRDSAVLALCWENKRIPLPLQTDTHANVVASLKNELRNSNGFRYQGWLDAANYLLENNLDLPLALQWADKAVSDPFAGQENFATLSLKARILARLGRKDESRALMRTALPRGKVTDIHQYGRQLLAEGDAAEALAAFRLNAQLHPHAWPVNFGLARGYSAVGDYPHALAALLEAQQEVPAGDTQNAAAIQTGLERLRRGEDFNQ